MKFDYQSRKKGKLTILKLQGELIDKNQAAGLLSEVDTGIAKNEHSILLNLEDLNYLNSSGLNVIINILTKARKAGGDVSICCVTKKVNDLLVMTKLNHVFNICPNEEDAIEVLNK